MDAKEATTELVEARLPADNTLFTTVFFPGIFDDLSQCCRYTGPDGFSLPNGSARLIYKPWLGLRGDGTDVQPFDTVPFRPWSFLESTMISMKLRKAGIESKSFSYPSFSKINIGQKFDVDNALRITRDALKAKSNPDEKIVLYGVSRGAAVCVQVAAQLTVEEIKHVGFIVLEAPFDSADKVLEHLVGRLKGTVDWFLNATASYDPTQPAPIDFANNFPHKELPIALITCEIDNVVPMTSTKRVYEALRASGCAKAELLVLKTSPHPEYSTAVLEDRKEYAKFLETFYTRYMRASL